MENVPKSMPNLKTKVQIEMADQNEMKVQIVELPIVIVAIQIDKNVAKSC
jgi:hypothetical protein